MSQVLCKHFHSCAKSEHYKCVGDAGRSCFEEYKCYVCKDYGYTEKERLQPMGLNTIHIDRIKTKCKYDK